MEIKIIKEEENKLFNRNEVEGTIESEKTPSREDVLGILSKKYSVPIENIKIKEILGKFGAKVFSVKANVYSSKEDKDKIELKKKKEAEFEKRLAEKLKAEEEASKSPEVETNSEEIVEEKVEEKSE